MDTNERPETNAGPEAPAELRESKYSDRFMTMEKQRAWEREQEAQRVGAMAGMAATTEANAGMLTGYPSGRLPLRVRVENQLNRAVREGTRAQRLRELAELLAQHPDVARILDLVDELAKY